MGTWFHTIPTWASSSIFIKKRKVICSWTVMELVMPPVQKASQILSMRFFISPVIILSVLTILVLNTLSRKCVNSLIFDSPRTNVLLNTLIRKCVNSLIFDAPRTNALTRCRIHTFLYEAQLHCVLLLKSAL